MILQMDLPIIMFDRYVKVNIFYDFVTIEKTMLIAVLLFETFNTKRKESWCPLLRFQWWKGGLPNLSVVVRIHPVMDVPKQLLMYWMTVE